MSRREATPQHPDLAVEWIAGDGWYADKEDDEVKVFSRRFLVRRVQKIRHAFSHILGQMASADKVRATAAEPLLCRMLDA